MVYTKRIILAGREYLHSLGREFLQPVNYLIAIGIGLLIHVLQGQSPLTSVVPYIVPLFVQAFSKSYVKFSSRHQDLLLSLPGRRVDPAFLMDCDGNIELAAGNTRDKFRHHEISRLSELLRDEDVKRIIGCTKTNEEECGPYESYSPLFGRWYRIKTGRSPDRKMVLVWFEDITTRKDLDEKLSKIRDFSDEMISNLDDLVVEDTSYRKLAELMLEIGYEGVFIAEVGGERLTGRVYKSAAEGGETVVSDTIEIDSESKAPIWLSRREGRLSYDEVGGNGDVGRYRDIEEFQKAYPFDEHVVRFLGMPIHSFINYHEGDVSIIAFNLNRRVDSGDLLAMEVLINSARSISSLLSLASENEQKFLQSVTGLCAAAEYSDEITGLHILRVNEYSKLLAEKIGMAKRGQFHIGQVAAMHDIGKVAIPHLIKLDRAFTPEERKEMEMHTVYGAQIIEKMMTCCATTEPRLAMAYEIALNHHQMWNGNGYPPIINAEGRRCSLTSKHRAEYDNLRPAKGSEIPLTARIVALADTYDALRSARQYKPAKSHEETAALIQKDDRSGLAGEERFGPDIMELFSAHHEKFAEIYEAMQE